MTVDETTTGTARLVGRVSGASPGPMIVTVAGIHGNEPAGLEAARRVLARLETMEASLSGDLVVFAGNVRALARGDRYVDRDLNRQWTEEKVGSLRAGERAGWSAEDHEQFELLTAMEDTVQEARGEVVFIDLHTTSAEGIPFAMIGDNLRNRRFALHLPIAVILGLEELIDGPLLEFMSDRGYVTLGIEGSQHGSGRSVEHLESALWIALEAAGLVPRVKVIDFEAHRTRLAATRRGLPHVMEVLHRHAITAADRFIMLPGFANIQRVRAGELLARDQRGEIRAGGDAIIFLPLYQPQGDDGFFLGREVRRWWLHVSGILRSLHAGPVLRLLPGVRRDPSKRTRLLVDDRFIRWYPLEVLSLFGFRKIRREKGRYLISRRRQG